jgi:hypothetical protein
VQISEWAEHTRVMVFGQEPRHRRTRDDAVGTSQTETMEIQKSQSDIHNKPILDHSRLSRSISQNFLFDVLSFGLRQKPSSTFLLKVNINIGSSVEAWDVFCREN